MTEVWKSHKMHWCDVCKCWMNDSKQAIQHHEQGMGHKAKLAARIRDMGRTAEAEKKKKENDAAALKRIEKQAQDKFLADQKAAAAEAAARQGKWVWDASCCYYYNEVHRWYYDPKSKYYYGGEPTPEWKETAPIPSEALFGTAPHEGGPAPQPSKTQPRTTTTTASTTTSSGPVKTVAQKVVVQLSKHPLNDLGGYQAPTNIGSVGAAKGVANSSIKPTQMGKPGTKPTGAGDKRQREEQLSKEELEARARREAARARVAAHTAQQFGYL